MITFQEYLEEAKSDEVYIFDIDDAILFSKSKIYYTEPGEKQKSVGTQQFADIRSKLHPDTEYDFRDFRLFKNIYTAISKADPFLKTLKYVDKAVHNNIKIGIITARGNQDAVRAGLKDFLLFKDKDGQLKPIPRSLFRKKFIFAVSDSSTSKALQRMGGEGSASSPEHLKATVLQKIFGDKFGFKRISFFDDDPKNIDTINALNDKRITAIKV